MNEKVYHENNYTVYQPPQCLKQMENDNHMFYSYSNFPLSNTLSQNANFMDVHNASTENFSFQQNNQNSISAQQEQPDLLIWESRIPDVEKTIKMPDKIDMIEISSKDLSPASSSYCSNIDLIISDSYKQTADKDLQSFNKLENEWCFNQSSCTQKSADYDSCAQEKSTKYFNTQKNPEVVCVTRNCNYNIVFNENSNIPCRTSNKDTSNEMHDYMSSYYDNKFIANQPFIPNVNYFNTNISGPFEPLISTVDQQTEVSNEESDIIVEESDEEITDYSEDQERRLSYQTNKCLICNIRYKPQGTQFYFLTAENPLTMSTQKPVIEKLVNVIGEISTTSNYLCSECLGLINNIDHLQLKLENIHTDLVTKFKRTCQENKIPYGKRTSYKQKSSCISKFPKYKCKLCKKILCLKEYCLYHLKRHRKQSYLCDSCGKVYSNKRKFSVHCVQHTKKLCKTIDSFKCSNCDRIFRTKSNKKDHENYCLGTLPFKCKHQFCNKKFPSATKLKNHVRLKHDKKFIVICSICNIGFIKVSDYKSHMVSHSTDKKYSCLKCNRSYKTSSNLNFHMKIHSDSLPFSCNICNKGFMRKEYFEAHMNNHNGVKNYSCTNCDKKFVSQKNLDAHLKYHEGTVKKNTCNICGKTMTTGFEEHLRIHNNLKEFECEHCDMKFNTKGTLSKHAKKNHLF